MHYHCNVYTACRCRSLPKIMHFDLELSRNHVKSVLIWKEFEKIAPGDFIPT